MVYLKEEWGDPPFILYYSTLRLPHLDSMLGNPLEPAYVPSLLFDYPQKMTFFQRVSNTLTTYFLAFHLLHSMLDAAAEDAVKLKLWDQKPDFPGLISNASLVFYNSNPILGGVRPTTPNTIEIGGLHAVPAKPLTGELKTFVDGAKDGVVYVSYGSVQKKNISLPSSSAF